ncbi:MAG: PD40 domain-containing protein [Candidatus Aminicenantes bacterium]|nr:PD40 domain-containing protein [Candidatus Aminicenantes bacterium]
MKPVSFFISLIIFLATAGVVFSGDSPLWLRYPAISPDGESILFCYKGDIYRVNSGGGGAVPLTLYQGHDFSPVWSHDGKSIAFASDRFGNFDVYIMPSSGGKAIRLTFHSSADIPSDFTPDNRRVIFSSNRLDSAACAQFPRGVFPELYTVSSAGGRVTQLLTLPAGAARFDSTGSKILFHDTKGLEDHWRKRHVSSVTRDIILYDFHSKKYTRISDFAGEDLYPVFSKNDRDIYYLSEAGGSFNLFKTSLQQPAEKTQLTHFEKHPVRFLSTADNDTLCFSFNGEIYTLDPGSNPKKVDIHIHIDDQRPAEEIIPVTSGATEMALSPKGKEIAFIVRGEIFVTSVDSSVTKQVTRTPEQERWVSFSPDGRSLLYAAERKNSWNLYRTFIKRKEESYFFNATVLKEEPVLVSEAETFQPAYSPDGKEVAYLEEKTTLKVIDLSTKKIRTILPGDKNYSYADGDRFYQWSPDGRRFLVQFQQPNYWFSEAGLIRADGSGEVINLTESGYNDLQPRWMMNGKMMIWFSDRDGMRGHANSGDVQADVYGMFFTRETFDRFKLSKEEYDLLVEKEKKQKDKKKDKEKKKKGKELEPLKIDMSGLKERKVKLTIHSSNLSDALVTPDGENLIYLCRFEKGYDLWLTKLRTKATRILAKLGGGRGSLLLDKGGKKVFLLSKGKLSKIEIKSGKKKPIGYKGEMALNTAAERAYLFDHVYRQVAKRFYRPDFHKVDWEFYKRQYAAFLPHINNNYDFAELLSEFLGELNASHTGASYRPVFKKADATASLGLFFDETHEGNGLKITEVMEKSPLKKGGSKIKAGVIIEKIDGTAVTPEINFNRLLNRKAGKYMLLSLFDEAAKTRWEERVQPISRRQEALLLYRRWVNKRKKLTEKLSKGRIGYIHVRGMNDPSFRTVYEEAMGKLVNKEALVVDTRFNGGGDLVEDLSIFLSGKRYMDFKPPRQEVIGFEPQRRWTKPSIVIMSEGNYSDAHCFPWTYKALNIGKLVGMPVPGTCTFVLWERLQDETLVFGVPNMGITVGDGTYLENVQLEPDIRVENEPEMLTIGRDRQLERAIEELLKEL